MRYLALLLLIVSVTAFGQKDINKKLEEKLLHLEYSLKEGRLGEVIGESRRALKKYNKQGPQFKAYYDIISVQAKARFLNADYSGFNEVLKTLEGQPGTVGGSVYQKFVLAEGYRFAFQPLKALEYLDQIEESELNGSDFYDLALIKASIKYQQGYYKEALSLLEEQEAYREKSPGISAKDSLVKGISGEHITLQKKALARVRILKSSILVQQGYLREAETEIRQTIEWLNLNLSDSKYLTDAYFIQGLMLETAGELPKAIKSYLSAYSNLGFGKRAPGKGEVLYKLAYNSIKTGDFVKADHYIRNLQINSVQLAKWTDPVQPYYELALIHKYIGHGDLKKAKDKLKKLEENFQKLPYSHPALFEFFEAVAKVSYGLSDFETYFNTKEYLTAGAEKCFGSNSPKAAKQRLLTDGERLRFEGIKNLKAENFVTRVFRVTDELNPEGLQSAKIFDLASSYYFNSGKPDSAVIFAKKAAGFKSPGTKDLDLSEDFYNLKYANYLAFTGKVKEASEIIKERESRVIKLASSEKTETLNNVLLLSQLYRITDQSEKSLRLSGVLKSFARSTNLFVNNVQRLETELAIATIYKDAGNFYKAEKIAKEGLLVARQQLQNPSFILPFLLLNAEVMLLNGGFNMAEKHIREAVNLSEKFYGENSYYHGVAQKLYAEYLNAIGDYKNAASTIKGVVKIFDSALGGENCFNIDAFLLQADVFIKSDKVLSQEISSVFKKSIELAKDNFGENSEKYNDGLIKYSEYLVRESEFEEANQLLNKAYEFYSSNSNNTLQRTQVLLVLGKLFYAQKDYTRAEEAFTKAENLIKSIFSKNHYLFHQTKNELAKTFFMQKRPEKALDLLEEIIPGYLTYIEELFPTMSFRQKSGYWANLKEAFEFYNFLALKNFGNQKPELVGKVYNNVIAAKAILLSSDKRIRESIAATRDSSLVNMFEEWVSLKEMLGSAYNLSKQEQAELGVDLKATEQKIEDLEKKISLRSSLFAKESARSDIDWQDVRNTLKANECVIEMIRLRHFDHTFSDSAFYAALVVTENSKGGPEFIDIPNAEELEGRYYKYHRNVLLLNIEDDHSFNKYWAPISEKTKNSEVVYFSPDGIYYQINPETFKDPEGNYLIDKYSFTLLSNSKDLVSGGFNGGAKNGRKKNVKGKKSSLLGGNPAYYSTTAAGEIAQLPGAEEEVNEIEALLNQNGISASALSGAALSEDTVKILANSTIVHFATHGFFKESTFKEEENFLTSPLLNSGLLFYEGGEILDNNENINGKSGVLTAYEVASLNLTNTDLVVLSACETGRGEVVNGEGVFGLQRSFLSAGANAVIMSLFRVNDEVTRKFMVDFYEYFLKNGNKREAFTHAKKQIKKEYPSPINWGAFIIIESEPKGQRMEGVK